MLHLSNAGCHFIAEEGEGGGALLIRSMLDICEPQSISPLWLALAFPPLQAITLERRNVPNILWENLQEVQQNIIETLLFETSLACSLSRCCKVSWSQGKSMYSRDSICHWTEIIYIIHLTCFNNMETSLKKKRLFLHFFVSGGTMGGGGGVSSGRSTKAKPTHAGWDRAGSKSVTGSVSVSI